jgi:hypothetical protein
MAAVLQIIAHFVARKNHRKYKYLKGWSEWQDSNVTLFCLIFQHVVVTPSCNRGRFQGCRESPAFLCRIARQLVRAAL